MNRYLATFLICSFVGLLLGELHYSFLSIFTIGALIGALIGYIK